MLLTKIKNVPQKNILKLMVYHSKYHETNKKDRISSFSEYDDAHKEEKKGYFNDYYYDHNEERKGYYNDYYYDHKEERKAYFSDYYGRNNVKMELVSFCTLQSQNLSCTRDRLREIDVKFYLFPTLPGNRYK